MEIVQLPDEIVMMYEYDRIVRHIYTDGRAHDEFLDPPLWMGDSIGKWEGDTLVIDVIGFNDKTWIDRVRPSAQRRFARHRAHEACRPRHSDRRDHDRGSQGLHQALDRAG